jgi:hypothetical protein
MRLYKEQNDEDPILQRVSAFVGAFESSLRTLLPYKSKLEENIKEADLEWWVFRNVSKKQDYPIFMAHVEEIGYKRGVRKEEKRPNQLFNSKGEYPNRIIYIDTENPKTILDYLRKYVIWNK